MFFEQGQNAGKEVVKELTIQLKQLKSEKEKALDLQKSLLMQINSQSDPAWIELTLRKVLGVVPEGQTKVFFTGSDSEDITHDKVQR